MAVNWTREQKQVIEGREKSLLVSAAAGSGKTAVLVERIIQMITEGENPKDIDRLLVMTFTRAAAAEMRERIQAAIEKKLESEPENEHLQQQAVLVQFAQITTIDSFCLHVMREHFDRLDIDPAFRVGDEGEMLLMRADVMDGLLEDYYRDGGKRYEEFVDAYATGKADGGIAEYVMQVYNFAQSNPWPDAWYEKCREELLLTEQGELEQTEWMQFLLRDIALQAQEWEIQLREAWEICQETGGPMKICARRRQSAGQPVRLKRSRRHWNNLRFRVWRRSAAKTGRSIRRKRRLFPTAAAGSKKQLKS